MKKISLVILVVFLLAGCADKSVFKTENDISYFVLKHKEFYPKDAEFSFDITKYIGQGFTVTYGLIQIAKYMGF